MPRAQAGGHCLLCHTYAHELTPLVLHTRSQSRPLVPAAFRWTAQPPGGLPTASPKQACQAASQRDPPAQVRGCMACCAAAEGWVWYGCSQVRSCRRLDVQLLQKVRCAAAEGWVCSCSRRSGAQLQKVGCAAAAEGRVCSCSRRSGVQLQKVGCAAAEGRVCSCRRSKAWLKGIGCTSARNCVRSCRGLGEQM